MDDVVHSGWARVFSAQYPVQHAWSGVHDWPVFLQTGAGTSQKHAVPAHGTICSYWFTEKHCIPVQQLASEVQDCDTPEHGGGGGPQTPVLQTSVALQHGSVEQDSAVCAQVGTTIGAVHVPWVQPAGISQVFGEQQSPLTVQLPPAGMQAVVVCVLHVPPSQNAEQQLELDEHVSPFGTHPPQTVPSKQYPVQHCVPVVHPAPTALHDPPGTLSRHSFADVPGTV